MGDLRCVSFPMAETNRATLTRRSPVRRWYRHLLREWTLESLRAMAPAYTRPNPATWGDDTLTASWLGHATVLINFFGITMLTDPALFRRVGISLPGLTIGPKRLTAPALSVRDLPRIDLVLLSHAHFDHFDLPTLRCVPGHPNVITAPRTRDLLRWTKLRKATELRWGEKTEVRTRARRASRASVRGPALGCSLASRQLPRLQRLHPGAKRSSDYLRRRHGHDRQFRQAPRSEALRSRDHVDRRLRSLDPLSCYARRSCRDGECGRSRSHHAGASSDISPERRAVP